MPAPARLTCEEVHVLAHAAEMRIVVLRHQRDAEAPRVVLVGEDGEVGKCRSAPERSGSRRRSQERHGRLVGRTTRDTGARNVIEPTRMKGITLLGSFPCSPQRRLRRCTLLP